MVVKKGKKGFMEPKDGKSLRKEMNKKTRKERKAPVPGAVSMDICGGHEVDLEICESCGLSGLPECGLIPAETTRNN